MSESIRPTRPLSPALGTRALIFLFAVISGSTVTAAEDDPVAVSGPFSEEEFFAGGEVRVTNATARDIFAAGGEVVFDSVSAADVIVAGGSVRLSRMTTKDVLAAGGQIEIESEVGEDLIAAGGRIRQRSGSEVSGYAVLAGGDIELAGRIGGNLKAAGGRIRLSGEVVGDVDLVAGRVVLEPDARIGGRLVYRSGDEAEIAPDAVIAGGVEHIETKAFDVPLLTAIGIGVGLWLIVVLSLVVLGIVFQMAIPRALDDGARAIGRRPWVSLVLGFALLVATPIAANVLLVTVLGIPLGLFTYAVYAAALPFALITIAYWMGCRGARSARDLDGDGPTRSRRLVGTSLGLLVLAIVAAIPLLGWLVVLVALAVGLGGFAIGEWHRLRYVYATTDDTAPTESALSQ